MSGKLLFINDEAARRHRQMECEDGIAREIIDNAGKQMVIIAALVVTTDGTRVAYYQPEYGDGFGTKEIQDWVVAASPALKDGETLKIVRYELNIGDRPWEVLGPWELI